MPMAAAVAFRQFDDGARVGGNRVEQDFTRAVQARPGDVNALMARGLYYATPLVWFDRNAAVSDFSEVLRLDPKSAEAYMLRAPSCGAPLRTVSPRRWPTRSVRCNWCREIGV